MIKPKYLKKGDTVCVLSLSWGGPATYPDKYYAGKHQLEQQFGVNVIEGKYTLKDAEWLYNNPKARAEDLMEAFRNPQINAIFSSIGGEDSIRMLPYIDLEVIKNNPKIFMGYSDSTVTHFMCFKAGLVSFYGPSIMAGFGENGGLFDYMIDGLNKTIFTNNNIGERYPNQDVWTSEFLTWSKPENQKIQRKRETATEWRWLQGSGIRTGQLLGGCVEVLEFMKSTSIWPDSKSWEGKILFLESSEEQPSEDQIKYWLRNYAAQGILKNVKGILLGRSQINSQGEQKNYDNVCLQVVRDEEKLDIPIITNMDFGHTDPMFTLPYGVACTINCDQRKITIDENCCL